MIVYFLGILVSEIIFIILSTKKKDKKYLKISNGLFFGLFVSIFVFIIYCGTDVFPPYDTNQWIGFLYVFIAIILGILNLITGVVSLIIQKKKKYQFSNTTNKKQVLNIF